MKTMKQILAIAALFLGGSFLTLAQSTAFTYQGRLTEAGAPADGTYEFRFALYDALTSGSRVSAYFTNTVTVVDGLFTASMDFGSGPFTGADRWLEIGVKTNGSTSNYWVQRPRQPLTPAPLAIRSLIALSADQLGGQGPGDYVAVSGDTMTGTLVLPANGLRAGTDQLVLSGGRVGIGTSSPSYPLHLADTAQIMEKIVSSHTAGTWLDIENTSTGGNRWGFVSTGSANGEGAGHLLLRDITDGRTVMTLKDTGNVGIGTTAPEARLHLDGGSETTLAGGGYLVLGSTSGQNVSFDDNEIQARILELAAPLNLNPAGGNVTIGAGTYNSAVELNVFTSGSDTAIHGSGGAVGVAGWGSHSGGYFKDSNGTGEAWLGIRTQPPGLLVPIDCGLFAQSSTLPNGLGAAFVNGSGTTMFACQGATSTSGNGSKLFVQNHPYQKDKVIAYTCLEGDETGTYTRGSGRLVNGEARIVLGETFKWVTNPDIGLTAQLTPRDQAVPLAVVSVTTEELVVRGVEGGPDVAFDYIVNGLRIGFEESSVVRPKDMEAWIPSMAANEETYAKQPELRQFNALERFKAMRPATQGRTVALSLSRANALRDAITVYDPAIHQMPHPPRPERGASESVLAQTAAGSMAAPSAGTPPAAAGEAEELRARVAALEALVAQLADAQNRR